MSLDFHIPANFFFFIRQYRIETTRFHNGANLLFAHFPGFDAIRKVKMKNLNWQQTKDLLASQYKRNTLSTDSLSYPTTYRPLSTTLNS